jgi:hypothetical protein
VKERNPAVDSYAIGFINGVNERLRSAGEAPWLDIKIEYDGSYHQVWIWVMVAHIKDVRISYEFLVNHILLLEIDETKCELNLMLMCRLPDGKLGHIADLVGKQDIIDFYYKDIDESDIIVGDPTEPNMFSNK